MCLANSTTSRTAGVKLSEKSSQISCTERLLRPAGWLFMGQACGSGGSARPGAQLAAVTSGGGGMGAPVGLTGSTSLGPRGHAQPRAVGSGYAAAGGGQSRGSRGAGVQAGGAASQRGWAPSQLGGGPSLSCA